MRPGGGWRLVAPLLLGLWPALALAGIPEGTVTVLPLLTSSDAAEAAAVQSLAAELAQRCPSANQIAAADLRALLPSARAATSDAAVAPNAQALFLSSEDGPATALRLLQLISALSQDPAALLASPPLRRQLREAYLFAARAVLHGGDRPGAQRLLRAAALRFADQPPPSAAEWGPALHAADQEVRQALPPAQQPLALDGPAGWAVHIDEQPVGALPAFRTLLTPGPHAVVVVARDGTRWSWSLELPLQSGRRARLYAGPPPAALCSVPAHGVAMAALCAPDPRPPADWSQLGFSLAGDVLLVAAAPPAAFLGWRLHPGAPAPAAVRGEGPAALATLVDALCPGERPSAAAPPVARPALVAPQHVTVTVQRAPALSPPRAPRRRWPAAVLLGAGVGIAALGVPLLALQGRCVSSDCARVYDFHGLAPALTGAGAALALGGGIWLAWSYR